jgi:hypothetical protein
MTSWTLVALFCAMVPSNMPSGEQQICVRFPESTFPTAAACKAEMGRFKVLENVSLSCEQVTK